MRKCCYILGAVIIMFGMGVYIGEWDNFRLKGSGYQLFGLGTDHVWVIRDDGSVLAGETIVDFAVNGDHIFFLRMVSETFDCLGDDGKVYMDTYRSDAKEFWVVNRKRHEEVGPMDETEFNEWLIEREVSGLALKIGNIYRPSGRPLECMPVNNFPD